MIALLVVTDGRRDCIAETIPCALANLTGPITHRIIFDDSGDDRNHRWLQREFPTFDVIFKPVRQGFGGAISAAWRHLQNRPERYVFHLEDDFTFNRSVSLPGMASVLDERPNLLQLALRRQPWNDHERSAGGIVEMHPESYVECFDGENDWLEHRVGLTTNPSLYRRSLCYQGWPTGKDSEGRFSHMLMNADPELRFGYWGARHSGEWVTHIGRQRVGTGY